MVPLVDRPHQGYIRSKSDKKKNIDDDFFGESRQGTRHFSIPTGISLIFISIAQA